MSIAGRLCRGLVLQCSVLQHTVGARLVAGVEHSVRCFADARAIVRKDCRLSAIWIGRNRPAHGRWPESGGGVLRGLTGRFVSGPGLLERLQMLP